MVTRSEPCGVSRDNNSSSCSRSRASCQMSSARMGVFQGALCCFILICSTQILDAADSDTKPDGSSEFEMQTEARLVYDLLKRALRLTRPVHNTSETVHISYGMALIALEGIDEVAQNLNTNVWLRLSWRDTFLSWDPAKYDGINHVRIPANKIWNPDMVVYNSRGDTQPNDVLAVVSSDGTVLWIPPARLTTHCTLDMTYFPMDTQTCHIKIGSWTYDGFKMDIDFYDGLEQMDTSDYIESNEWRLMDTWARKNVKYYPCCVEPYPDLTFSMKMSRMNHYYNFVYIGPAILLALLVPFIFLLPPADTQKVMLGVGLLICFTIFFNSVGNVLPTVHVHTPLIDRYYMAQYVLIVASIMLSTIVANIARKTIRLHQPPAIVSKVLLSCLGRALCVSRDMYSTMPSSDSDKTELALQREDSTEDSNQSREWLLIATVIDRLFFLMSIITTFLMTVIILNSYPRS